MFWGAISSIAAHGGELDIHLLDWIKEVLDGVPGLGDWGVVALTGGVIIVLPVGLLGFYLSQRKKGRYYSEPEV